MTIPASRRRTMGIHDAATGGQTRPILHVIYTNPSKSSHSGRSRQLPLSSATA